MSRLGDAQAQRDSQIVTLRPIRFDYALGAVFLVLAAFVLLAFLVRGVNGPGEAIIAVLVVGGAFAIGVNELMTAALAKIAVNNFDIEIRGWLGRRRRMTRNNVKRAVLRSIFIPSRGEGSVTVFMLVDQNSHCLARLDVADYGEEGLARLARVIGVQPPSEEEWANPPRRTVRRLNREFPGAYPFDFQLSTLLILGALAAVLAIAAALLMFR